MPGNFPRVFRANIIELAKQCNEKCWPAKLRHEQRRQINHVDQQGRLVPRNSGG